jgi:DNA uptake protein ComE-like DNA-binding protein
MGLNINNVTKRELMCLLGLCDQTAEKIIEFREDRGRIRDIEELRGCEEIEEGLIRALKKQMTTR